MSDLFTEVDEALKQERLEKLWQKYGGFLIGFLAVIVLGTAANEGYIAWKKSHNEQQTAALIETLKTDRSAEELLNVTELLDSRLTQLVKIQAAGLLLNDGDKTKAMEIYAEVSKDAAKNSEIKSLADYMTITLDDSMSAEEKIIHLKHIADDEDNPWRFQALIDSAVLNANGLKNYTAARAMLYDVVNAEEAPKSLRQKAQSLDILYAAQGSS